jgi:hypothetical protein
MRPAATVQSFSSAPTGLPDYPTITPQLATKYGEMYKAVGKDEAGNIKGQEVLRSLASVPVEVTVKRDAWEIIAGLSLHNRYIQGTSNAPLHENLLRPLCSF